MMMKALLWRDYRVNRLVLIIGCALLVGPFLVGGMLNLYAGWRDGVVAWD